MFRACVLGLRGLRFRVLGLSPPGAWPCLATIHFCSDCCARSPSSLRAEVIFPTFHRQPFCFQAMATSAAGHVRSLFCACKSVLVFRRLVRPSAESLQRLFAKLMPADVHVGVQAQDGVSCYWLSFRLVQAMWLASRVELQKLLRASIASHGPLLLATTLA